MKLHVTYLYLKVSKDVYQQASKLSKVELINILLDKNIPVDVKDRMEKLKSKVTTHARDIRNENEGNMLSNDINVVDHLASALSTSDLNSIPSELVESMNDRNHTDRNYPPHMAIIDDNNDETLGKVLQTMEAATSSNVDTEKDVNQDIEDVTFTDDELHVALEGLKKVKGKQDRWHMRCVADLKSLLEQKPANEIEKSFTREELKTLVYGLRDRLEAFGFKFCTASKKAVFVNILSTVFGDGSQVTSVSKPKKQSLKQKTPQQMKKEELNSYPKEALVIGYSHFLYEQNITEWEEKHPFPSGTTIGSVGTIASWYSKPLIDENNKPVFGFLDASHGLVNMRVRVCTKGIPERGIHKDAWIYVATAHAVKTGFKLPVVEDLCDKQNIGFARKTFSQEVENAMRCDPENRYEREADFCKLLRGWYDAEDEPGLSVNERYENRVRLRAWLLEGTNFAVFPPYGSFVLGIPVATFDSLLVGIERRCQMVPYLPSERFCSRAVSTLDIECFFSTLVSLDPHRTGCLNPDDVGGVMSAEVEITQSKLNPKR